MSYTPQGLGKQVGQVGAMQNSERNRTDSMSHSNQLGYGSNTQIQGNQAMPGNLNQNGMFGSGSQNLLQSTSSIGYNGNMENQQNQYAQNTNNQYSQQAGGVGNSTASYSQRNQNQVDYGNMVQNNQSPMQQMSNRNQGYQKSSIEQFTPISQHSTQGNFTSAQNNAQTAQINLANSPQHDLKQTLDKDRNPQQKRESNQQRQNQKEQEEHDHPRTQLVQLEEMRLKQQLEREASNKKDKLKQRDQEKVTNAQLQQFEELKRLQQQEKEAQSAKLQKKKELEQYRKNQQHQQGEQNEKRKKTNQQKSGQISPEKHNMQQRDQEDMMQQQQSEQEELYQQQLHAQSNKIMEQQILLEQMKQALSNQQKPLNNREPPSSVKRTHTHKVSSGQKQSKIVEGAAPFDQSLEKRLDIIETSLNRVCNQHDALMPLLQLLETVPSLQRSEQQIKNLAKKYSEVEKRLKEIESTEKKDTQYQHVFNNIDRNFKNTANQISQLKKDIVALENNINAVQQIPEAKLKEDTLHLYRQVDTKLDRNMRDVKSLLADFKNQISINIKRGQAHSPTQERIIKPSLHSNLDQEGNDGEYYSNQTEVRGVGQSPVRVYNDFNSRIDTQINQINTQLASHQKYISTQNNSSKAQIDIDIANIYREIGMLRSEMELLINKARSEFIQEQLQNIVNPTETEKQLFIAGLEQNMFLQEIESFDHLNQQRISDELEILEDKLHLLNADIIQMQQQNTIYNNINLIHEVDSERADSTSQNLLIDQYRDHQAGLTGQTLKTNQNLTNIDVSGYELKFIGDRIFNYKQQIHGTKKKYLCDCRRLEDRLQTLEYLSNKAEEEGTDNHVIHQICQIDKFQNRVDTINNSIGNHVSILVKKLQSVEDVFASTKSTFKKTKGVFSSP